MDFRSYVTLRVIPVEAGNSFIDERSAVMAVVRDFGASAQRIRAFFAGFAVELKNW